MKLDRLLAITMLLINRSRMSAKELAEHFEVNVRTIYRDIDALCQAGIPIIAYQGANGGYGIMENYKIDRNVLTADEISAIITALRSISATMDDRKILDTLEKIKGLIPPSELDMLKQKSEQVIIDLNPWGTNRKDKEKYDLLKSAICNCMMVTFSYTNSKGESAVRTVEPSTIIFKWNMWYLQGYCLAKNDFRIFKLSRIKDLHVTKKPFTPREEAPKTFPWEQNWNKNQNPIEIVLKFSPNVRTRVEDYFMGEQTELMPDGHTMLKTCFPEDEWLYGMILGYGENVEVLAPPHLRAIIAEKAKKVVEKYGQGFKN